ncbi:MAG TPA: hypothetical protein VFU43_15165 [Streptosporangiaceae bacterium]|nr:hypothetical protein [Streptosporangiaceae bacterium]
MSNTIWRPTALLGATVVAWAAFAGANATALPTPDPTRPASAPTGDNGTVKVHRTTTPADDPRDEPHVCGFYLVGFNFDPGRQVTWRIVTWPPTGDRTTVALTNSLVLDANGHGRTTDLSLPDGHYKLYWNFVGENGSAKHKVFWVDCTTPPTGPPVTPPGTPTPTTTPTVVPTDTTSPSGTPSQTPSEGAGQGGHSTSPPPAQVAQPVKSSGNLPFTGFAGRLLAALGAALVLGGAGAIVIAHRRRGRHASTSS